MERIGRKVSLTGIMGLEADPTAVGGVLAVLRWAAEVHAAKASARAKRGPPPGQPFAPASGTATRSTSSTAKGGGGRGGEGGGQGGGGVVVDLGSGNPGAVPPGLPCAGFASLHGPALLHKLGGPFDPSVGLRGCLEFRAPRMKGASVTQGRFCGSGGWGGSGGAPLLWQEGYLSFDAARGELSAWPFPCTIDEDGTQVDRMRALRASKQLAHKGEAPTHL